MPAEAEQEIVEAIKTKYPDLVLDASVLKPKLISILVKREGLLELAGHLRDEYGFIHPSSAGAVDWPKENRMQMIYYLVNPSSSLMLVLRVDLPRGDLRLPTMTRVWDAMNFHEREAGEMFGIEFEGHPNPVKLLLPPDWRGGYPLRKDFKGEGVQP